MELSLICMLTGIIDSPRFTVILTASFEHSNVGGTLPTHPEDYSWVH
jgi:hypothetical protein